MGAARHDLDWDKTFELSIDPEKAKAEGELALKEVLLASNADNAGVTPPQPMFGQTHCSAAWW